MDSGSWQRLFSPFHGRNMRKLEASGHLENNCLGTLWRRGAWWPVLNFSTTFLYVCFKTRKWCHGSRPNPSFYLRRRRGLAELDKGKNKEELTSGQVGVCVHLPWLCLGDEQKRNLPSWWVYWHGHGRPWLSTWEYGAVKDLWLLWVWQLGENRLRWIWASIQSPACTVENMAGYQVPSLPSCGWQVSSSCQARCFVFEPVCT